MKPSNDLLTFLKLAEGFTAKAIQPLPGDAWTMGFGFTYINRKPVKQGDTISYNAASQVLMNIVLNVANQINAQGEPSLPQRQYDAVVSLVYNIGIGNFLGSTTAAMYYAGQNISNRFIKWNLFQGKPCDGLTNRRLKEKKIYDLGIYQ